MTRALITGGSGYFGCALRDRLAKEGGAVRILDLVDNPDRPTEIEFRRADIRDAEAVAAACRDVDVVYHNVAQVPLAKDSARWILRRVQGVSQIAENAA